MKVLIKHRKATFGYEILERFVAGIILNGGEVKSIINGNCSIAEGHVAFNNKNEVILKQVHIDNYKFMDQFSDSDETRDRKLLLNKSEVRKLIKQITVKGLTIIPLAIIYSDTKKIKVEIALCKGKKMYDKRHDLKKKQANREADREMKRQR